MDSGVFMYGMSMYDYVDIGFGVMMVSCMGIGV